jgi:hypothetical protein
VPEDGAQSGGHLGKVVSVADIFFLQEDCNYQDRDEAFEKIKNETQSAVPFADYPGNVGCADIFAAELSYIHAVPFADEISPGDGSD